MKNFFTKVWEWIKQYWGVFLAIIGIAAIIEYLVQFSEKKPLIPTIDVEKEKAKIDSEVQDKKEQIDKEAQATIAATNEKTPEEVLGSLSPEAQAAIKKTKEETAQRIINRILGDLN